MNVLSIFTMGLSLLGGSGGMLPQKILKSRYPRLAKIDFFTCKMRQNSIMQPMYSHKSGPKTHHASSFFLKYTGLKNNKFTASRTEIVYNVSRPNFQSRHHAQITLNSRFQVKKMTPKTHHAKICVCVCVWGGGGGAIQGVFKMQLLELF